eukprot:403365370
MLFIFRRLTIVIAAVILQDDPYGQILLFLLLAKLNLIYIFYFKPYEDSRTNVIEVMNEISVLGCSYQLLIFTDYEAEGFIKEYFGYGIIAVILINFVTNISIMVYDFILRLKLSYKKLRNLFYNQCKKIRKRNIKVKKNIQTQPFQSINTTQLNFESRNQSQIDQTLGDLYFDPLDMDYKERAREISDLEYRYLEKHRFTNPQYKLNQNFIKERYQTKDSDTKYEYKTEKTMTGFLRSQTKYPDDILRQSWNEIEESSQFDDESDIIDSEDFREIKSEDMRDQKDFNTQATHNTINIKDLSYQDNNILIEALSQNIAIDLNQQSDKDAIAYHFN